MTWRAAAGTAGPGRAGLAWPSERGGGEGFAPKAGYVCQGARRTKRRAQCGRCTAAPTGPGAHATLRARPTVTDSHIKLAPFVDPQLGFPCAYAVRSLPDCSMCKTNASKRVSPFPPALGFVFGLFNYLPIYFTRQPPQGKPPFSYPPRPSLLRMSCKCSLGRGFLPSFLSTNQFYVFCSLAINNIQ